MLPKEILTRFQQIRIWHNHDRRAPHKPLLALWAIGRCLGGEKRLAAFDLIDSELTRLMMRFGPHNSYLHTHYPFWRLQNDQIWEIDRPHLVRTTSSGNAHRADLLHHGIQGGLWQDCYDRLQSEPTVALKVVSLLLGDHFPDTLHQDILQAVGITEALDTVIDIASAPDRYVLTRYRRGQGAFRASVLNAYEQRCAVCAFSVRVQDVQVALEAAHIRWHTASGPPETRNGLSLCSLHHKLFDYGAFTVFPDLTVFVSESVNGQGVDEALGQYHEREFLGVPPDDNDRPADTYLSWHQREVFRTPHELSLG